VIGMAGAHVHAGLGLRRAYDDPSADDGYRVLVDRVWPRGRSKAQLELDDWIRDIAPSSGLRGWFGHDPSRWDEFRRRYRAELASPQPAARLDELAERATTERVTLVFGAHDEVHNQAQVIAEELQDRGAKRIRTED
jgi:uncharacterized protein YeaO (DUF488 family)